MIGQTLERAAARCCGYPLNSSLRPCFADKGIGPIVPCGGCEKKQEVRLWCGICGKDAPAEAYVGYDAAGAVEKMNAENRQKIAASLRRKNAGALQGFGANKEIR